MHFNAICTLEDLSEHFSSKVTDISEEIYHSNFLLTIFRVSYSKNTSNTQVVTQKAWENPRKIFINDFL
jgi:hypothetical protein